MTLAEFFQTLTATGVQLAQADGQLQLHGPAGAVTPDLQAVAAEHKTAILALTSPGLVRSTNDGTAAAAPAAARNQQTTGFRHSHEWRDWRLEWLLEVGTLALRMRGCTDPEVFARLKELTEATPTTFPEWVTLWERISAAEHDLARQGKLPAYPWPVVK